MQRANIGEKTKAMIFVEKLKRDIVTRSIGMSCIIFADEPRTTQPFRVIHQ